MFETVLGLLGFFLTTKHENYEPILFLIFRTKPEQVCPPTVGFNLHKILFHPLLFAITKGMRIFLVIVLSFALLSHLLGAPGKHFLIETDGDVTEHDASNNNPIKTYTTDKDAIGNDATDNKPE